MSDREFFDYHPSELEFLKFDIETTGFKSAEGDYITTIVLHNRDEYQIWLNTNGDSADESEITDTLIQESGLSNITVYACESERDLLLDLHKYLSENTSDATVVTAFNGETYKGSTDFDLPFVRTRCLKNGVPWIFKGFWYMDSYEVLGDKTRMDTTVQSGPNLEEMDLPDLQQFVDDMGFGIQYDRMEREDIIAEVEQKNVTPEMVESWAEDKEDVFNYDPTDISTLSKANIQAFIDDKSYNINYDELSKADLIQQIREEPEYSGEVLVEWHEKTGRDIGRDEMTTLEDIHEVLIESRHDNPEWVDEIPFELELFEPFDPYESSGEAVTGYLEGDFSGVILHCLADVARTVNLTRLLAIYTPQYDYRPKNL